MQPNAHRCPYKKIGVAKDIIDNLKQRQLEQSNIYNNLLKKYHECSLIVFTNFETKLIYLIITIIVLIIF